MTPEKARLIELVREYLQGKADWEAVHRLAIDMEWKNVAQFTSDESALEELHMVFLADSQDDPQFRADHAEIERLLTKATR